MILNKASQSWEVRNVAQTNKDEPIMAINFFEIKGDYSRMFIVCNFRNIMAII